MAPCLNRSTSHRLGLAQTKYSPKRLLLALNNIGTPLFLPRGGFLRVPVHGLRDCRTIHESRPKHRAKKKSNTPYYRYSKVLSFEKYMGV